MSTVAKIRLAVGIVFVLALAAVFAEPVLSMLGIAAPARLTSVVIGADFAALPIAGYLLDGNGYERFALFAPMAVGFGYTAWYARYSRRHTERYHAQNDTFS